MKEPGYTEITTGLRVSKSFYRKTGRAALEGKVDTDVPIPEVPGLTGRAKEAIPAFEDKATLFAGAEVEGLWHYSATRIDHFTEDEAAKRKGKFGSGTYFGAGELSGETVDLLRAGDTVRHDAKFTGNVLAVSRDNVLDVAEQLKALNGLPPTRLRSSIQNAPLTDLLNAVEISGQQVDAVLITMSDGNAAELAVLPQSVTGIEIVNPT